MVWARYVPAAVRPGKSWPPPGRLGVGRLAVVAAVQLIVPGGATASTARQLAAAVRELVLLTRGTGLGYCRVVQPFSGVEPAAGGSAAPFAVVEFELSPPAGAI